MPKTERFNLRISMEMRDAINILAALDGRSVSNYVENIISQHIKKNQQVISSKQKK
jgi:predicted HicB family RNase H-like nuclease